MADLHSYRGGLLHRLLARRGITLTQMPPAGLNALAAVRHTRELAPLLMPDVPAMQIMACVRAAARLGGTMAEAGVFAGATARLICLEKGDAPLHLFDVWETLQASPSGAESARAAELRTHFHSVHARQAEAERLLAPYPGVHFHPGVFPVTAKAVRDERFSFVHLDLDLEPSTRDALEFFHPRLLPGGILVGDDYQDPGVRRAFETYFTGRADTVIALPWGQAVVVKPGAAPEFTTPSGG
jgi:hypothetical protein